MARPFMIGIADCAAGHGTKRPLESRAFIACAGWQSHLRTFPTFPICTWSSLTWFETELGMSGPEWTAEVPSNWPAAHRVRRSRT